MTASVGQPATTTTHAAGRRTERHAAGSSETGALLAAGAAVGAILAGMAIGPTPLTTLGVLAALLVAVLSPFAGLAALAFMASLVPPDVVPAPGFNTLLVGAILLGCVYRLPIDRPRLELHIPLLLLLAFFLFVTVQLLPEMLGGFAGDAGRRIGYLYIQLTTLLGTVIAAGYVLNKRKPGPVLAMGLAGASLAALLAIAGPEADSGTLLSGLVAQAADSARALGPFGNPNYFGQFLAAAIALATSLAMTTTDRVTRLALLGVIAVVGCALLLSLSRGATTALIVGLTALALSRSRPLGFGIAVACLLGILIVYPAFIEWRLQSVAGSASRAALAALQQSDAGRLDTILAGPQMFLSSPLFGIGFGQYSELSSQFSSLRLSLGAHNWYMAVLAEQGLVGIILWLLLLVSVLFGLRSRPQAARWVGAAVLGVFVAGSLFTTQPVSFQTAALPAIAIVAALVGDWTPRGSAGTAGSGTPEVEAGSRPRSRRDRVT